MADHTLPIMIFSLDPDEPPKPFVFQTHSNVVSNQILSVVA
jgi:hypothetical protein